MFGLSANAYPTAGLPNGPMDSYTDFGLDSQFQYVGDKHLLSLTGSYIREQQDWNASSTPALGLAQYGSGLDARLKLAFNYYYRRTYGITSSYFSTQANQDNVLYATAQASGSQANNPNTNGMIYELDYVPWYNTKFMVQYTAYNEFNGGVANYDGSGRDAWDNNTLMVMGWFMY